MPPKSSMTFWNRTGRLFLPFALRGAKTLYGINCLFCEINNNLRYNTNNSRQRYHITLNKRKNTKISNVYFAF